VSTAVAGLVDRGWVQTGSDPADRRRTLVSVPDHIARLPTTSKPAATPLRSSTCSLDARRSAAGRSSAPWKSSLTCFANRRPTKAQREDVASSALNGMPNHDRVIGLNFAVGLIPLVESRQLPLQFFASPVTTSGILDGL